MSYFSEPPYFLLIAGLFVSLTSGSAFAATLKQIVQKWSSDRTIAQSIAKLPTGRLIVPFVGISIGVCLFLCSGLEVFGFPNWLAYAVGVPTTLLIGLLVWFQLGSMLRLVEREGFGAIDIDNWQ